jgi:hypothetical protein
VGVQRLQQLPRLGRVGVVDHIRIIAPTPTKCAPGGSMSARSVQRKTRAASEPEALAPATIARCLLTITKNLWRSAVLVSLNVLRLTYGSLRHGLLTVFDGNGNITSQRIMRCRWAEGC